MTVDWEIKGMRCEVLTVDWKKVWDAKFWLWTEKGLKGEVPTVDWKGLRCKVLTVNYKVLTVIGLKKTKTKVCLTRIWWNWKRSEMRSSNWRQKSLWDARFWLWTQKVWDARIWLRTEKALKNEVLTMNWKRSEMRRYDCELKKRPKCEVLILHSKRFKMRDSYCSLKREKKKKGGGEWGSEMRGSDYGLEKGWRVESFTVNWKTSQ